MQVSLIANVRSWHKAEVRIGRRVAGSGTELSYVYLIVAPPVQKALLITLQMSSESRHVSIRA